MPAMWRYEKGEHRKKHLWPENFAGFTLGKKGTIGKCPCDVKTEEANDVLNRGVEVTSSFNGWPDRIYSVFRGVIYEAVPTVPGKSYHAYPWRGDLPGRPSLPKSVLQRLEKIAEAEETQDEFKKWLKKYGR